MRYLVAILLFAVSTVAFADKASDHAKALRVANDKFNAAMVKCDAVVDVVKREQCRGKAKMKHTKAVEKADKAATKV